MIKISQHKGVEADQSHNYTIDVTRSELKALLSGLHCDVSEGLNPIDTSAMIKEFEKYVET